MGVDLVGGTPSDCMCPDLLALLLGVEGGREDDVSLPHSQQDAVPLHGRGWGGGGVAHIKEDEPNTVHLLYTEGGGGREGLKETHIHSAHTQ